MGAGTLNLTAEQGATFLLNLTWRDSSETPVDLSGYTARMQVRSSIDSSTILLELTTENGRIALGGSTGVIALEVSAAVMASQTTGGVYDLELISSSGRVTRLVEGTWTLTREVTR